LSGCIALGKVANAITNLFCSGIKTCGTNNNTKTLGLLETLDLHGQLLFCCLCFNYSKTANLGQPKSSGSKTNTLLVETTSGKY
jgi:hypothetical protein